MCASCMALFRIYAHTPDNRFLELKALQMEVQPDWMLSKRDVNPNGTLQSSPNTADVGLMF